jgi:hypothetical protein
VQHAACITNRPCLRKFPSGFLCCCHESLGRPNVSLRICFSHAPLSSPLCPFTNHGEAIHMRVAACALLQPPTAYHVAMRSVTCGSSHHQLDIMLRWRRSRARRAWSRQAWSWGTAACTQAPRHCRAHVSSWRATCRGQQPQRAGQQVTGCINKYAQHVLASAMTLVFAQLARRTSACSSTSHWQLVGRPSKPTSCLASSWSDAYISNP